MLSFSSQEELSLSSVMPTVRKVLGEFEDCRKEWDTINDQGTKVLRSLTSGGDGSSISRCLTLAHPTVRIQLDAMYSRYDDLLSAVKVTPVLCGQENGIEENRDETATLPRLDPAVRAILECMQEYIGMYDDEYMLKETVQSIIAPPPSTDLPGHSRYFTAKHASTFLALWTVQPYLNLEKMEHVQGTLEMLMSGMSVIGDIVRFRKTKE
ncbi:hypothetical protein BC936DRAFT_144425 [Jimgerdemannia flammicorona]|uniref:Uncharacterized protein n=1 Tax=Jimgerdemannia flammicorona TaxID=994334 RepID=A0A433DCH6_9FUNG|nr:hypothetical protein BC936DRAFT_144425 [Jimgerdemannia flammicorona]